MSLNRADYLLDMNANYLNFFETVIILTLNEKKEEYNLSSAKFVDIIYEDLATAENNKY